MEAAGRRKHAAAARATTKASQVGACAPRSRKGEKGREKGRGEHTPRREEQSVKQERAVGRPPCLQKTRPTRSAAPAAPPPRAREKFAVPFYWGGVQQVMTAYQGGQLAQQREARGAGSPSHRAPPLRRRASSAAVQKEAPVQPRQQRQQLLRRLGRRRRLRGTLTRPREPHPSHWPQGERKG